MRKEEAIALVEETIEMYEGVAKSTKFFKEEFAKKANALKQVLAAYK